MENPVWHNLVVRMWRDGDGLKVRFLASQNGRRPATLTVATNLDSAAREFEEWLRSIDSGEVPPVRTELPKSSTQERRDRRRGDDGASAEGQTAGS